jgi:hypothetical protein
MQVIFPLLQIHVSIGEQHVITLCVRRVCFGDSPDSKKSFHGSMVAAVEAASLFEQPERPGIGDGVHPDKVKPPFPFLWTGFHISLHGFSQTMLTKNLLAPRARRKAISATIW